MGLSFHCMSLVFWGELRKIGGRQNETSLQLGGGGRVLVGRGRGVGVAGLDG